VKLFKGRAQCRAPSAARLKSVIFVADTRTFRPLCADSLLAFFVINALHDCFDSEILLKRKIEIADFFSLKKRRPQSGNTSSAEECH